MNNVNTNEQKASVRAKREAFWRNSWQKRNWRTYVLSPFAYLFYIVAGIRRTLYRTGFLESHSVPVPVIVVGGIMIGGVGKTPIVVTLARILQKAGFHPAIISRGYTLKKDKSFLTPRAVGNLSLPSDVGDEPTLLKLKTNLPVWVGHNRAAVARSLCRSHPECDVILCDDGLQHYALSRDIEIAIIDERGVGNGWCLPAGPLREGPTRLNEVDAVIRHYRCKDDVEAQSRKTEARCKDRTNYFNFYSYLSDSYDLLDSDYRLPLSYFAGKATLAIAGIAQPEVFFNMLAAQNIHGTTLALPDHFEFDSGFVQREVVLRAKYILMTEKDAVKYKHLIEDIPENRQRFWVVPLEVLENTASQELSQFLVQRLTDVIHELNKTKEKDYE